jgi:hypothetical protein
MNREDIIRMAREANILEPMGFDKPNMEQWRDDIVRELEAFAALVRADEREACVRRAEVAMLGADRELTLRLIAAIQARGQA